MRLISSHKSDIILTTHLVAQASRVPNLCNDESSKWNPLRRRLFPYACRKLHVGPGARLRIFHHFNQDILLACFWLLLNVFGIPRLFLMWIIKVRTTKALFRRGCENMQHISLQWRFDFHKFNSLKFCRGFERANGNDLDYPENQINLGKHFHPNCTNGNGADNSKIDAKLTAETNRVQSDIQFDSKEKLKIMLISKAIRSLGAHPHTHTNTIQQLFCGRLK